MLINNFNVIEQQENSINSSIIESYEKVTSQLNVTYVFLELLVAVIAIVGNGLVIVVFCRERKLRRKTNYYIVSLATADFFLGLFGIPFAILVRLQLIIIDHSHTACFSNTMVFFLRFLLVYHAHVTSFVC